MIRTALACTALLLSATCAMSQQTTPAARAELAPSGKLRVGINHSNFLLVNPGSPHGAPKGIAPDLALELGKRLGVPIEYVSFDSAGKTADAIRDAAVDADSSPSVELFQDVAERIETGGCVGGGCTVTLPGVSLAVRAWVGGWNLLSRMMRW